jgi:hypothetical protein
MKSIANQQSDNLQVEICVPPRYNEKYMRLPDEIRQAFRKYGATGGRKRAANLSEEERRESARKAAKARWAKAKKSEETDRGGR